MKDGLLTVKDLARQLKLSENRIRKHLCYHPDRLPKPEDIKNKVRWKPEKVQQWLLKQQQSLSLPDSFGPTQYGFMWTLSAFLSSNSFTAIQLAIELSKSGNNVTQKQILKHSSRFPVRLNLKVLLATINYFGCTMDDLLVDISVVQPQLPELKIKKHAPWQWDWTLKNKLDDQKLSYREFSDMLKQYEWASRSKEQVFRLAKTEPLFLDTGVLIGMSRCLSCKPGDLLGVKVEGVHKK